MLEWVLYFSKYTPNVLIFTLMMLAKYYGNKNPQKKVEA
jgi:hypothetical protein